MEIKAKRHEEQQRELDEGEENSVRNHSQKMGFSSSESFSVTLFFPLNISIALTVLLYNEVCLFIKSRDIFCLH